jgi:hypothetical protein
VAAETLQRVYSPEKNTSRESRKRYYKEVDHDKDSEEEFKLPIEEDDSSNGTVEDSDAATTMTKPTTKPQVKKQRVYITSEAVARAGTSR